MMPKRTGVALVLALALIIGGLGGDQMAQASTFNPQFASPVTFSDTSSGGHPDITVAFDIPPPSAIGGATNFGDSQLTTASDVQIPTGAYIGRVNTIAKLGLFNGGCNSDVSSNFDLVEASTPATTGVLISGAPGNLAEDDGDLDEDGIVDQPAFAGNGIADGADAYPAFLLDVLDPDGPGGAPPLVPSARYFGVDIVFGLAVTTVQVVVLEPGALASFPNQGWMTSLWGTPSLVILNDPTSPPANQGITDFCNLSSTSTILGQSRDNACTPNAGAPAGCSATGGGFTVRKAADGGCPGSTMPNECGFVRATTPASPATLTARVYAVSDRDYDDDGHANSLDVCVDVPNSAWDPRASNVNSQDSDGDGLPNACDPSSLPNSDEDGDGWSNRIDNCPGVANSQQPGNGPGTEPNTFQWDQDVPRHSPVYDAGPHADGIGPDCDPDPNGPNGHYHATVIVSHVCIGLAADDGDGDGVCNAQEPAANTCAGGVNDADCDNDGIGDRLDNCLAGGNGPSANPPPPGFAQSQLDLNSDGFSDITDIVTAGNKFGKSGGHPGNIPGYEARLDLNYDSTIDISDITRLGAAFGKPC